MLVISNYDNFILEKYGYNIIASNLSDRIISIVNDNFGKLLINKKIQIKNSIGNISNIKFINDTINIKLSERSYGNMNPTSLIIDGKNIYNLILNLELKLSETELRLKRLTDNKITDVISHECLHIIELFLTKDNDRDFTKSWEMGEKLHNLKNKYINDENWQNISYFIYLSLPHELRGRLQQLNNEIKGLDGDIIKYIKNTKIFKDIEFLSNVDENILLSKIKSDSNYKNIIKDFSEYFLNSGGDYERNFLKYIKKIKIKNKKYLHKILKSSYNVFNFGTIDNDINYNEYKFFKKDNDFKI